MNTNCGTKDEEYKFRGYEGVGFNPLFSESYLVSLETGEKHELALDKEVLIGRMGTGNNIDIEIDSNTVSREHAIVFQAENDIFVKDSGSRNKTVLNGNLLDAGKRYNIKNGDIISFADCKFQVELNKKNDNTIKLGHTFGVIENVSGSRRFSVEYDSSGILEYEKQMLIGNRCPFTLPMYFLNTQGQDKTYYDFTGYIQLSKYIEYRYSLEEKNKNNIKDALEILTNILESVKGAEDYMLPFDRISLMTETIFANFATGKILLAYLPSANNSKSIQDKTSLLIEQMDSLYKNVEISVYFERLKKSATENNLGLNGIISNLGMLQREVSYIQWTGGDLRTCDQDQPQNKELTNDESETAKEVKQTILQKIKEGSSKVVAIQGGVLAGLTGIFLTEVFDITDFVGFSIIVLAVDFWLMKSMKHV